MRLSSAVNIRSEAPTDAVVQPSPTYMVSKFRHLLNIKDMSVTFAVLKLERSSSVSDVHAWNIPYIVVTFAVFRFSKPVMEVRFEQFENH